MPGHARRWRGAQWLVLALCAGLGAPAHALPWQAHFEQLAAAEGQASGPHLIGLRQGTELTGKVRALGRQGYELADGQPADVLAWYRPAWTDTELSFMSPLQRDTGLIWGFSTGERGPKYRIDPSVHIGLVHAGRLGPRTRWSIRITTVLGGRLRERACMADYGEIGGVQAVNCRLAASEMQPSETLRYLLNQGPDNRTRIALRFVHEF